MELLKSWVLLALVAGSYAASLSGLRNGRNCLSTAVCNTENSRYEEGNRYTYRYAAETKSWINGTSEQASMLKFTCKAEIDVISPCELMLTLSEVTVQEADAEGREVAATNEQTLRNELESSALRFAFAEGLVTDVCPETGEAIWALNFKRGFLSALQAPVTEVTGSKVITTETDVTGICPVTFTSTPDGTVRKFKEYEKCQKRVKMEGGFQVTALKPEAPTFNIMEESLNCNMSFRANIVSESSCLERHFAKVFSQQRSGAVTVVRAVVNSLEITPASAPTATFIDRRTTILFDQEKTEMDSQPEILARARDLLTSLSGWIGRGMGREVPNLFSSLVTEMERVETLQGMEELRQFAIRQSADAYDSFKDALTVCETTPSVETMMTIIDEVAASEDEDLKEAFKATRAVWMTYPSIVSRPTKEMITAIMPVMKTLPVEDSVFFLPISSLINRYCTAVNPDCLQEAEVVQAVGYFQQLLGYDCTPSEQVPALKMLMALKALANIRRLTADSKIGIINKCFDHQNADKGMDIRVAALEVIRRLPCKPEYQTYAKSMFKNHIFDSELRIAAYRALMTCPSQDIMETVRATLAREESDQVGSYVWSHLSNLNETSDPQRQHLKEWVRHSGILQSDHQKDLRKFSRNMELSYYNAEAGGGVTIDGDMIFSSKSYLPRELRLNNTVEAFGYAINLFEIGGRLEGMHHLLESYLGPRGYLREHSLQELFQEYRTKQQESLLDSLPDLGGAGAPPAELPEGLPEGVTLPMYAQLLRMLQFQQRVFGQVPLPIPGEPMPAGMPEGMTQELYDALLVHFMKSGLPGQRQKRHLIRETSINDIESEYHVNREDQPQASVYLKMFGNELVYLDVAKIKSRLSEMKSSMNPIKVLMNLAKEQTHQLANNAVVLDHVWTVPTLLGLPMRMSINGTVSIRVRTQGKVDMRGILMAPRGFEINGVIEPSAALEVSASMTVTARQTRSGLNQINRLHSSLSLGGKIQVTDGKAFVVELSIPDQKQEIIDVSTNIYVHVQEETLEMAGIPERIEKSYCSGTHTTKYIGGQFCTSIAFPKSFAKDTYPLFPFSGPSHLTISLEKTDPSLTRWRLEGSYGLEKTMVEDTEVETDKFHLMFGAPDTDTPRTFDVEFAYNRNEKETSFNVVTPIKTLDVFAKVTNSEVLRKLELAVTLDKVDVYTLDTEVESQPSVVDGDVVINFYPRLDVAGPAGPLLKFRSSIGVRDGQQTRVNMWMSLDSPRTSLVTVSGDVVKTESSRKVRFSSDLQISGRYLNANVSTAWQKQKDDDITTIDVTLQRRVNNKIVKDAVISAKYTPRSNEGEKGFDLKSECAIARYPLLSFLFETEYIGTAATSQSTSKLCYRYNGQECGRDTKVVMGHELSWGSGETGEIQALNVKVRNPANSINLELQQSLASNQSRPVDLTLRLINNTSELEVAGVAVRVRTLGSEPARGDFSAAVRTQTWRYEAQQDWELGREGRAVLNTRLLWEDQQASLAVRLVPTANEETGLVRYDFDTALVFPLASVSAGWHAWKRGRDFGHGASATFAEQPLFAYGIEYADRSATNAPDFDLQASLNVTRPMSPLRVALLAGQKGHDILGTFNVSLGDVHALTAGFSLWLVAGEDGLPVQKQLTVLGVDLPRRDFSLFLREDKASNHRMVSQLNTVDYNKRRIYRSESLMTFAYDPATESLNVTYVETVNMTEPLCDQDWYVAVNVSRGRHDYLLEGLRNKVPVLFLNVTYRGGLLQSEPASLVDLLTSELLAETYRHSLLVRVRTPLVVLKDVSWNTTVQTAPDAVTADTRLLYFPGQERPFALTVEYLNKSDALVTHHQLTTTAETTRSRVALVNTAKFDLAAGSVVGSSGLEMGPVDGQPERFELTAEYTNGTKGGSDFNNLAVTLSSPESTIRTETGVTYVLSSEYAASVAVLVSEEAILSVGLELRNDSDAAGRSFDAVASVHAYGEELQVHAVHNQDRSSFESRVELVMPGEPGPLAEVDVTYAQTAPAGDSEVHTVTVAVRSAADPAPLTVSVVYTDGPAVQDVAVVVSTSPADHLDVDFSLATGTSDAEGKTYDLAFTVDNTYMPGRKFELVTHCAVGDEQSTVNSDVTMSDTHIMNVMVTLDHSATDAQWARSTRATFTFPTITKYAALASVELSWAAEVRHGVSSTRQAEMRWGQRTDDERVGVRWTRRAGQLDVQLIHSVEAEHLPKEFNVLFRNDTDPMARRSFEIQVNSDIDNLASLLGSYSVDIDNARIAELILTRPNHDNIELTLEMSVTNADKVFGTNLQIKYSEDKDRLVEAILEIFDTSDADGMGYDVNLALAHLVSGLDLSTVLTVRNDRNLVSAGIEGEILIVDGTQPFNLDFKWDKEQKKYTLLTQTLDHKLALTGQYEDRSYADHKIYRVTMTNTYNDDYVVRSMFEFNGQQDEISYTVNHNPDNPEDFMRFRSGFLNETALLSLLESEIDGIHTVDARLLVALETPKILMTDLEWNPKWANYIASKYVEVNEEMQERLAQPMERLAVSRQAMREKVAASWADFALSNADGRQVWDRLREQLRDQAQVKMGVLEAIREDFKTGNQDYWGEIAMDMEPLIEAAETRIAAMKEDARPVWTEVEKTSQEYMKRAGQRLKSHFEENVVPLFEEMKELIASLSTEHRVQMDLLIPHLRPNYGLDALMPQNLPAIPAYFTGEEGAAEAQPAGGPIITSIKTIGEKTVTFVPEDYNQQRLQRLTQMKMWTDLKRIFNETRDELRVIFGEIQAEFEQTNVYADLTARLEELQVQMPVGQWRQTAVEKVEEIRASQEMEELRNLIQLLKIELVNTGNMTEAGLNRIRARLAAATEGMGSDFVSLLDRPLYEVVTYDPERGQLLVRLHLRTEVHSLRELPAVQRRWQGAQRLRSALDELRHRTRSGLGEVTLADGSSRSLYDLAFEEPSLLYREGHLKDWLMGERVRFMRQFWATWHGLRLYLNPVNWIPPHEATAVFVSPNHYMTFDRSFYDFSGGCSYLLAHDFADNNFTVVIEYDRTSGGMPRRWSIVLYMNSSAAFEIKDDGTVFRGKQLVELPTQFGRTTISRRPHGVVIDNSDGVRIGCDLGHQLCRVTLSGWFFGKTAGLLGTYSYEGADDRLTSDGDVARHLDDLARSWRVGKRCSSSTSADPEPGCSSDPEASANALCTFGFLNQSSSLTQCHGVVDPTPYYSMCSSRMCEMTTEEERRTEACKAMKAYVDECNRLDVGIAMPDKCVVCEAPTGPFSQGNAITLQAEDVDKSADVILIVEEKPCLADKLGAIRDVVSSVEAELKRENYQDNRYGLVGFGGEGVHNAAHIHTIDGHVFNTSRALGQQGLEELRFAGHQRGSNDTFEAILTAANYPFRAGVAKHIILFSCSNCQQMYNLGKVYKDVAKAVLLQGIQLNVLTDSRLELVPTRAKNTSPKNQVIYGLDQKTVLTNKALSTGMVIGDKSLRKLVSEPANQCALLAYESEGALYDLARLGDSRPAKKAAGAATGDKRFLDLLSQRLVQETSIQACSSCRCIAGEDGTGRADCGPCSLLEKPSWQFDLERSLAEVNYYGQLGMQSVMDYMGMATEGATPNKTPKALP